MKSFQAFQLFCLIYGAFAGMPRLPEPPRLGHPPLAREEGLPGTTRTVQPPLGREEGLPDITRTVQPPLGREEGPRQDFERSKPGGYRIVNGDDAEPGEWPHQAQLLYNGHHHCGGSLVHKCYVVTARHCVTGINQAHLRVRLGEHNRLINEPQTTQHTVFKVIVHPTIDVALLVISPSADLTNDRISTIALASANPAVGTLATVTGWGQTESLVPGSLAVVLQEVEIPIADPVVCNADVPGTMAAHEICAGTPVGAYANACHGDSGGPLVVEVSPGVLELVGIVSWGNHNCPSSNHYAVYVSVAAVRDWIMHYIPPASSSPGSSCVCALPATLHDDTAAPATFDGANCCYLAPARIGCANEDEETKSFIHENRYYIKSSAAIHCPAGTFDSCNCYIGPKPAGGFIHDNNFYQPIPVSGVCPPGTTNDGAHCLILSAPWATTSFIYDNNFYTTARKQCAEPTQFLFDGANCRYVHAPGPNPFISENGYYSDKSGASCPAGSSWDAAHCYFRKASWATTPFLWDNRFYCTPRRQCYEGAYDGANCFLATPPDGATAFIRDNNYYYRW